MMTPLLPTIAHSLATSVTAMGLAMTLYMLPYGFCQFFYGPLGDRVGAIRVVRWAAIGFGVGTLLTGQAPHVLWPTRCASSRESSWRR
jgi:DHA1 family 2-module integral membrane pump EmrD-like MFS transporter